MILIIWYFINNINLFQPHYELEPIVSHISNLLNDSATKLQGLLLLNSFLPQCPLDIFEQKGSLWITLSTKVLVQKKPQNTVCLALRVLSECDLDSYTGLNRT